MTKKCSRCLEELPLENFSLKTGRTNARQPFCKKCNSEYLKEHYSKNKEYYKAKSKNHLHKMQEFMLDFLKDKKCKDCENSDIRVLEFDHLRDKKANIAHMLSNSSLEEIKSEIEKCEIVCCNCHRIRTLSRSNSYRVRSGVV